MLTTINQYKCDECGDDYFHENRPHVTGCFYLIINHGSKPIKQKDGTWLKPEEEFHICSRKCLRTLVLQDGSD